MKKFITKIIFITCVLAIVKLVWQKPSNKSKQFTHNQDFQKKDSIRK